MTQQQQLLTTFRERMISEMPHTTIREVKMFGGIALMVDDAMFASINDSGALLARVAPDRDTQLLDLSEASRAHMGAGRPMGNGWITVSADSLQSDDIVDFWFSECLNHHRTLHKNS